MACTRLNRRIAKLTTSWQLLAYRRMIRAGFGPHRFAQAHLVSQDAVDAIVVQACQPVYALLLVGSQFSLQKIRVLLISLQKPLDG